MCGSEEIIKKLPKESWLKLTETATETFTKVIYPLTAITEGVGKLLEQKFNTLHEAQKILAAQCIQEAHEKIQESNKQDIKNLSIKPKVIYHVFENADNLSDSTLRDLSSNMVARELTEASVHPEIARIFKELTSKDLLLLSEIIDKESSLTKTLFKILATSSTLGALSDPKSYNHVYLKKLGLIEDVSGNWFCTTTGKELIRSIDELK